MRRAPTFVVLAVAIAVAAGLFLLLRDDGDEGPGAVAGGQSEPAGSASPGDGGTTGAAPGADKPERDKPKPPPEPEVETIEIRRGQPLGGVRELEFEKGERIRFRVHSDVADHVHLHGYDVFQDVAAGGVASFDVPATIEGVFEVELEDRVVPIAEITVTP